MLAAFSSVQAIRLDNTNATHIFQAVSHRVPKVYYIYRYIYIILTCRIQSDESKLFGSQQ